MSKKMPPQKPGKSEQSVATPPEFIRAAKRRLGIDEFAIDLAADDNNRITHTYYGEDTDSLKQSWLWDGWCWLNPPYTDIKPWVEKAWNESRYGAHIAVLVPAAVGSNWWRNHVEGKAYITYLNGRITFVGHTTSYPKDLALLLYAPFLEGGHTTWRWK